MAHPMTGDFSGWVYKQGSLVKSWKKRFMVLRQKQLTYFDTAQITPKVKEKGSFKVITVELSSDLQNGLIIHGVNGRVLKLYTDSSESTSQWYNAIMEACNNKTNLSGDRATICSNPEQFSDNNSSIGVDSEVDLIDRLDIQGDIIDDSQVKYCGWLLKEGSRVKSWKRRYFSLRGNVISYFNSADTGNYAKGYGTVCGVQVNMTKFNSLDIQFDNGRVLRVAADTEEEMEKWLAYLSMAANIGKAEIDMLHPALLQNPRVSIYLDSHQTPQRSSLPGRYHHGGSNQSLSFSASSTGPSAPNRHSSSSLSSVTSSNDINVSYAKKKKGHHHQYSSANTGSSSYPSYRTIGERTGVASVPEVDIYDSENDDSDGDWI
jgi:hypothetical protein